MTLGRPVLFDDTLRQALLDAVAGGLPMGQAAAHVGIHPNVPSVHARADTQFAARLTDAKAAGRKVRAEGLPHGEYRYNHHQCRCRICTTDHTRARAARATAAASAAADDQEGGTGEVHDIRTALESPLPSLFLAKAS